MNIALFFITHEGIAKSLISIGEAILQTPRHNLDFIEVPMDASIIEIMQHSERKIAQLDTEDGIIFFTDIFGGTPSNIAQQLAEKYQTELISGINLPMLIRLLSYRESEKSQILLKALDGAHQGIQQT